MEGLNSFVARNITLLCLIVVCLGKEGGRGGGGGRSRLNKMYQGDYKEYLNEIEGFPPIFAI